MALVLTSQSFQREMDQLPDAAARVALDSAVASLRSCASDEGILTPLRGHRPYVRARAGGIDFICADLRKLDGRLLIVRALRPTGRGPQTIIQGGISRTEDFRCTIDVRV